MVALALESNKSEAVALTTMLIADDLSVQVSRFLLRMLPTFFSAGDPCTFSEPGQIQKDFSFRVAEGTALA